MDVNEDLGHRQLLNPDLNLVVECLRHEQFVEATVLLNCSKQENKRYDD